MAIKCEYGCGQIANHQLKNGKWCCSSWHTKCQEVKRKNITKQLGKVTSEETKLKMMRSHKNRPTISE